MEKTPVKKNRRRRSPNKEKKIYDLTQMLEISKSLCSVLEHSTLIESILYTCMCQMKVLGAGMFVAHEYGAETFEMKNHYSGFDIDPLVTYTVSTDQPQIKYLFDTGTPITLNSLNYKFRGLPKIMAFETLSPSLIIPLRHKSRHTGILLLGERIDIGEGLNFSQTFSKYEIEQITAIATLSAIAINNASLLELTTTDMLTHLKLRHYFFTVLTDKYDIAISTKQCISVLMLDIDFFKRFNDTYGHACGDYVLQEVARIISEGIRAHDMAGRYGGEEFIVMLPNTEAGAAYMVAERIRSNIESFDFEYQGIHMTVTISIGVSVLQAESPAAALELVQEADRALYVSKDTGRNKVTLFTPEMKDEH